MEQDGFEFLAAIFTEWHRRWTETPDKFASWAESLAEPDDDYGHGAAKFFVDLRLQMDGGNAAGLEQWAEGFFDT